MLTLPGLLLAAIVGLMPPASLKAVDAPNDQGQSIILTWTAPEGESVPVTGYTILRSCAPDTGFAEVGTEPAATSEYTDNDVIDGTKYWYAVQVKSGADSARSAAVGPVTSKAQWFNTARVNILVVTVVICGLFFYYLQRARKGAKMYIRKIAGLDAIDDALGRATEMGKPILFSFGLGYITDMVVIAALPLLRKIAKKSAEYSTRLIVPNSDPIVMTAAQETVKEAYTEMGRPDFYNPDNVTFLTSDQFGYAAGVDGIILREKPGAIFWFGYFYAESLIMAETGHSVGAIQLAGTTETTQLPFFVAACDYTMIGEEIYAASCYLRPEPIMLGTLKGEDFIRFWLIVLVTATVVLGTVAAVLSKQAPVLNQVFETVVRWATPAY
ncbi:fibronectin type III domain-containing protein [candidate division WOR-3 bacterium]|uniref:Fibronectin type III domain-containing protein n=1 Tax=candidate division WOR-3 bacterium TaxID=2052148 RepID=A0A937XDM2_UNCW3|nr:fibronectin type III domain-containing protein [candidate division WOR-3 bacterium]